MLYQLSYTPVFSNTWDRGGGSTTPASLLRVSRNRRYVTSADSPDSSVVRTCSHQQESGMLTSYSTIFVTTPEPTVRPPSRMAKRTFSSIAMGEINSTTSLTLSPGMHISAPPRRFNEPVTSVVRK